MSKNLMPSLVCGKNFLEASRISCIYFTGLTTEYIDVCGYIDLYYGVHAYLDEEEIPFTISPDPSEFDPCVSGTYTFDYTADGYTESRTIVVVTKRTVLYTDGTLIINELGQDIENNTQIHGAAKVVYPPLDADHESDYILADETEALWYDDVSDVMAIKVGSAIAPVDTSYWFKGMTNAITADVSLMNTSNTEYMISMFESCENLAALDLSTFDTSNVINMADMFYMCLGITDLDLSNWVFTDNTVRAWTGYNYAEWHLPSVETLNLTNVDTSRITNNGFFAMFGRMRNLRSLDLSSFDTSGGRDFSDMFAECQSLTSLDLSMFDTSNARLMDSMFYECLQLTSVDLSTFDTSNVEQMRYMFFFCRSLETIELCSFSSESLNKCNSMFDWCDHLQTIYTNSFDCSSVHPYNSSNMFLHCDNIIGGNGTVYDDLKTDGSYGVIDTPSTPGYFTECSE